MKRILALILAGAMTLAYTTAEAKGRIHPQHNMGSSTARAIILAQAGSQGVPLSVATYVVNRESGFRCTTGGHYNGPLQISSSSARALGYRASEGSLNSCGAGLKYGVQLAWN